MRPLQAKAWRLHAGRQDLPMKDKDAERSWWESVIQSAARDQAVRSTKDFTNSRQYDRIMAELEMLAEAGFYWQQALLEGDVRRLRWRLEKHSKGRSWLARFRSDSALQTYLCAMSSQAFPAAYPEPPPWLYILSDPQWDKVAQMVSVAVQRGGGDPVECNAETEASGDTPARP